MLLERRGHPELPHVLDQVGDVGQPVTVGVVARLDAFHQGPDVAQRRAAHVGDVLQRPGGVFVPHGDGGGTLGLGHDDRQ